MKKICLGILAGLLVVAIGIYIIIKLWYWCAGLFPKPDPDPQISPSNVVDHFEYFLQPEQDSQPDDLLSIDSQSQFGPAGSGCYFTIYIRYEPDGIHLGCSPAESVNYGQFMDGLAALGTPVHSPEIHWNGRTVTLGEGIPVTIEQSADLIKWQPIVNVQFDPYRIVALTLPAPCEGNSFWRVITR